MGFEMIKGSSRSSVNNIHLSLEWQPRPVLRMFVIYPTGLKGP
jgi:hypothetical protein